MATTEELIAGLRATKLIEGPDDIHVKDGDVYFCGDGKLQPVVNGFRFYSRDERTNVWTEPFPGKVFQHVHEVIDEDYL